MFKVGDVVQAKKEWLDAGETQADTVSVVVEIGLDWKDRQMITVMNCEVINNPNYYLKPTFRSSAEYYELVEA